MMSDKMKNFLPEMSRKKLEIIADIRKRHASGEISISEAEHLLKTKVGKIFPYEIAYSEQIKNDDADDECIKEDLKAMSALFKDLLDTSRPDLPQWHPILSYYLENDEIRKVIYSLKYLCDREFIRNQWEELLEKAEKFKIHLYRKQNQLYPLLEKKGFDRPSKTMWTYDNMVRDMINNELACLKEGDIKKLKDGIQGFSDAILDLMDKEEAILYPTSLEMISESEFKEMLSGDKEIGYCLIEGNGVLFNDYSEKDTSNPDGVLNVSNGKLTLEQINLIYKHMPVDLSFVDENELVKFYTDTKHRIFPRSRGVIGREVKNCHPQKSVHIVEEIIEKFRSGEQTEAEFWIDKAGTFIYIKYIAVRNEKGEFKGVLEMMQDCTKIRSLQGSRTLLTWDSDNAQTYSEKTGTECPEITPDTKLKTLLDKYPELKTDMASINEKFKMLQTPAAKFMIPVVNLKMVCKHSGQDMDELIFKLKELIAGYEKK